MAASATAVATCGIDMDANKNSGAGWTLYEKLPTILARMYKKMSDLNSRSGL